MEDSKKDDQYFAIQKQLYEMRTPQESDKIQGDCHEKFVLKADQGNVNINEDNLSKTSNTKFQM